MIYGDIAKNWMDHGIYGLTHDTGSDAHLDPAARLSGVPGRLLRLLRPRALSRGAAGPDCGRHRRLLLHRRPGAANPVRSVPARYAFLLAAVCPFTANYIAAPLAETLSIFCAAVALDCAVAAFMAVERGRRCLGCLAGLRCRPGGRHSDAARRRNPARRGGTIPAVAHVEAASTNACGCSGPARCLLVDLSRSAGAVDRTQLARLPQVRTPGSALCQRSRRIRSHRIRPLGAHLDRRVRLDGRDLLADSRRGSRFHQAAIAGLRQRRRIPAHQGHLSGLRQHRLRRAPS